MRTLTFIRERKFIECLGKLQLLVQCSEEEATHNLNGKFVKLIGKIKNGETKTIEILDEQTLVHLQSQSMAVEYTIPSGSENITLKATPTYNPFQGNPFIINQVQ